jgi:prefoldin subunit 5
MSASETDDRLTRDNAYLLRRNAQLQDEVTALAAEVDRLRQMAERLQGRRAARSPDPLSGGQ